MGHVRQKAERVGEIASEAVVQLLFFTGESSRWTDCARNSGNFPATLSASNRPAMEPLGSPPAPWPDRTRYAESRECHRFEHVGPARDPSVNVGFDRACYAGVTGRMEEHFFQKYLLRRASRGFSRSCDFVPAGILHLRQPTRSLKLQRLDGSGRLPGEFRRRTAAPLELESLSYGCRIVVWPRSVIGDFNIFITFRNGLYRKKSMTFLIVL